MLLNNNNNTKDPVKWKTVEAIIIDIIVAFIGIIIIIATIKILFGEQIKKAINYVDLVSINTESGNRIIKDVEYDEEEAVLVSHPGYGTRYGNIKIDSLDINLPLYFGDTLEILKYGIGQSSSGYFPGEGGTIVCMGHNNRNVLYDLPTIQNDAIIEINTTYGDFKYKVDHTKVINMYDTKQVKIQKDEEILILYTCYPVNTLGSKKDRFVVYAKLINE